MYRYYKGAVKKETWKCVHEDDEAEALASPHVKFATVLLASEKKPPGVSLSADAFYQGPFYIDIDSEEIGRSIRAVKGVIKVLTASGVPMNSIAIWASGKKGFHLSIPMSCVTDDMPVPRLGSIYKQMVILFRLNQYPEVDLRVYSLSKGRMWRLPNRMREDNNHYKVPLSIHDLDSLTVKDYEKLTSSPRVYTPVLQTARVPILEAFFNTARQKVDEVVRQTPVFIDPVLHEALAGELPPCANDLLHAQNLKPGVGFNDLSLQFAKAVAAFSPTTADELISSFSDVAPGTTYNTPQKRKSHCMTAYHTAAKNKAYDWNCGSALSVLDKEPCQNCPIAFIRFQGEGQEELTEAPEPKEDMPVAGDKRTNRTKPGIQAKEKRKVELTEIPASNSEGLIQTIDGYGFPGRSGFKRISNFVLTPKAIYLEYIPNQEREVRVAALFDVWIGKDHAGQMILEEADWTKSRLIASLAGLRNAAYYGSDDDVQKLKAVIMEKIESNSDHLSRVYSCGIQRRRVGDQWVFTWVEPGWSIDQHGEEDLAILSGKVPAFPRLKSTLDLQMGDQEVSEVLSAMMKVNDPQRVAQVMGWTMACFLKAHIFTFRNEFPLLSLHGEPGSGKTSTAALFAALHGVDYKIDWSPINFPASTAFVIWSFVASSTTVPRLFEEFNKSKMGNKYELYAENLKACWNQHSVQRGTLGGEKAAHGRSQIGAHVVDIPLTGPVVICSEQEITMVSLVERTIQVRFSQRDKERPEYMDPYNFAVNRLECLKPFARAAYFEALKLGADVMKQWLKDADKFVPQIITGRPRYSYQIVLVGFSFLEHVVDTYALPIKEELQKLRSDFVSWLNQNSRIISTGKRWSEVDAIITKWNTMAAVSSSSAQPIFVNAQHYIVRDGTLYIDTVVALTLYLKFIAQERAIAVIDNVKEFNALVVGENYCMSKGELLPDFAKGRPVLALSIAKLEEKGISTNGFEQ